MAMFADLPSVGDIAGAVLFSCEIVFNVPDRKTIFEHAQAANQDKWLPLRVFKPNSTLSRAESRYDPIGVEFGDIIEYGIDIQLTGVLIQMALTHVHIISGSGVETEDVLVFEGDEYPGAAHLRRKRVIRVTLHSQGYATYQVMSETTSDDFDWLIPAALRDQAVSDPSNPD